MSRVVIDPGRFDELRVRAGFASDRDVADAADITMMTIYRVVRDGGPFSSKTLDALANALRCNQIDLLATEGAPAPFSTALASRAS